MLVKFLILFTCLIQNFSLAEVNPKRKEEELNIGMENIDSSNLLVDGYMHFKLRPIKGTESVENIQFQIKEQVSMKLKEFIEDCASKRNLVIPPDFIQKETESYNTFIEHITTEKELAKNYNYFTLRGNFVKVCGRLTADNIIKRISHLEDLIKKMSGENKGDQQDKANALTEDVKKIKEKLIKISVRIPEKVNMNDETPYMPKSIFDFAGLGALIISLVSFVIALKKK